MKKNKAPENMHKVPVKFNNVEQWRIMFYFVRFYVKLILTLQMLEIKKFTFEENLNYKLYIKIFDQKFGIPIFNGLENFTEENEVEINRSKIFYFFTTESSNLKQVLKNEEVDFRIVLNEDWQNPVAQCVTTCLSFYDKDAAAKTSRVKNTLNFFSQTLKYFKCQVYIGLNNDGEIMSDNIPLFNYKLLNTIYLTEIDYYSYHPLPDDWYELFVPPNTSIVENQDNNLEAIIDNIIHDLEFNDKKKKDKK
jgi:hypothetical protein